MDGQAVICAIAKNESAHIAEWILHHKHLGFSRVYLFDNGSTDGTEKVALEAGGVDFVRVIPWPARPGQLSAYKQFIEMYASDYEWCAFIDVDEFFILERGEKIINFLQDQNFGSYSAVLINWLVFGPAGHNKAPLGDLRKNFQFRLPDAFEVNFHVKTIARCAELLDVADNPHVFRLKGRVCNALGHPVDNIPIQKTGCYDQLVLNHYFTKSREEWAKKIERGFATSTDPQHGYKMQMFDHIAEHARVFDDRAVRLPY